MKSNFTTLSPISLEKVHRHQTNLFLLNQIEWQVWGTLTFKRNLQEECRVSMFHACLRDIAYYTHLHRRKLIWVLKQEFGKKFDRVHFHFFLAGLPAQRVMPTLCRFVAKSWASHGGGSTDVQIHSTDRNARDYCSKCSWRNSPNKFYESVHFGRNGDELCLSDSFKVQVQINASK